MPPDNPEYHNVVPSMLKTGERASAIHHSPTVREELEEVFGTWGTTKYKDWDIQAAD
jgi:hypothetical protein